MNPPSVNTGVKCVLETCNNRMSLNRNISYFSFPKDPIRCAKWIESSGISIPIEVIMKKQYRVCGKHFEKNMFLNDLQNRLQPHAIPVLHTDVEYYDKLKMNNPN